MMNLFAMCLALISLFGWYPKMGTVVEVENSIVTIEDANGDLWEMDGDGWTVGDTVELLMDSNNTATIYDDAILDARKVK